MKELQVHGKSMWPFLSNGERVEIDEKAADLAVGDVVAYYAPETEMKAAAHRIVKLIVRENRRFVQTKGDSQITYDDLVPLGDVYGAVCGKRTKRGARIDLNDPVMRRLGTVVAWNGRIVAALRDRIHVATKGIVGTGRGRMRMKIKTTMCWLPFMILRAYNNVTNVLCWIVGMLWLEMKSLKHS